MTQLEKLKRDFNRGKKHTVFTAMFRLGIGALHQRCNELKERGYPVKRRLVSKNGRQLAEFSRG